MKIAFGVAACLLAAAITIGILQAFLPGTPHWSDRENGVLGTDAVRWVGN